MKINKIKLAVAGAVLATASVANAGIIIPAGEWTIDLSGNVNSYAIWAKNSGASVTGGLAGGASSTGHGQSTGLLPNFLSFSGSTRQNDLDVTWLISLNPGGYTSHGASGGSTAENRQAFMTFGDKSWGTVKIGKDLGIYASDAILNDMTLLGVGAPVATGTTTLGRIGTGFQYADWKQQIAYTTPNFNGFQATVGITQAWDAIAAKPSSVVTQTNSTNSSYTALSFESGDQGGASPAYEGKASYSFAANDVTGKVWVSGFTQKVSGVRSGENQAWSADIGANLKVAGFDLTGYYYGGEGTGTTIMLRDGYTTDGYKRDVDGGYVQAKYTLPTKTVAGLSWGQSNLDKAGNDGATSALVKTNEMWTAGLYHPLTKHVNLVAEYSHLDSESQAGKHGSTNTGSLGGILFF